MLYDLTSIRLQTNYVWKDECTRITLLMAVLFYRVANNMLFKHSPFILTKHGTIHKLLDNCLALTLDGDDRLPEIFAATSYLLSDDYTIAADKVEKDDYEAQLKMALSCIVKGLACVKKSLGPDVQSLGVPSWQNMIAGLLFHKAGAVYYSLARMCSSEGRFGGGLKNCELAFKCIKASSSLTAEGVIKEDGQLLVKTQYLCGDFYLMLAKRQETLTRHEEEYIVISDDDRFLSDAAEHGIFSKEEQSWSVTFVRGFRENVEQSVFSYLAAINSCSSSTETTFWVDIKRRLGNVQNELGVHDMDKAAALVGIDAEPSPQEKKFLQRSSSNFESGISTFDLINDSGNKALVLSNLGRLKLIFAQAIRRRKRQEFGEEERGYFNQAFECYERAKLCIVERKENPHLWDKLTRELAESHFIMAKLMKDFTPLSSDSYKQVKSDVIELMEKALRFFSELRSVTPRQTAQFSLELDRRIFSLHLQLGSLYWSSYRNQPVDRHKVELSKYHFTKAFASLRKAVDYSQYIQVWPKTTP